MAELQNHQNPNTSNVGEFDTYHQLIMAQELQELQHDVMVSLSLMRFKWQRDNYSIPEDRPLKDVVKILLTILNWIASCFVTEPVGEVVATAVSAEEGHITFYIASNRGRPREEDKEQGETFMQLVRYTIGLTDISLITRQLLFIISPSIYRRFARKVNLILNIDAPEVSVQDRFNAIVDRWAEGGNMEDDEHFLSHSKSDFAEDIDGNERLKRVFDHIVSTATEYSKDSPTDVEICRSRIADFTVEVAALLHTKFSKSFDNLGGQNGNPIHRCEQDFIWILRLERRLLRVARYLTGAIVFARIGLPFIRDVLGANGTRTFQHGGPGVEIVWVGEQPGVLPPNHGCDVEMKLPPMTTLDRLFDLYGYEATDAEIPLETMKDIEELWSHPGSIKPCLHCELQMILFLQKSNIEVKENAIGNNKLMCYACNKYMEKTWWDRWVLSGTSGKPHNGWLVPPSDLGATVASNIKERTGFLVGQLAKKLGRSQDDYYD